MLKSFEFKKRVAFHETDCMGIVHHANYAKYFEEARVAWLYHMGLEEHHAPHNDYVLAVLDLQVSYKSPLKLLEEFEVKISAKVDGAKVKFNYEILLGEDLKASGSTLHIGVDSDLKVLKPPAALREAVSKHL